MMMAPRDRTRLLLPLRGALIVAVLATGVPAAPAFAQEQRPRNLLEMLFGAPRQQAEPAPTIRRQKAPRKQVRQRRANQPARQARRAAPVAPAPAAVEKAENAKRILVIGDFMAASLARGLTETFAGNANAVVISRANGSSGLVRDDFHDWRAELPALLDSEKPDLITIMLGGNDRQAIRDAGSGLALRTQAWTDSYTARVTELANALKASGRPFVWVGQPSYQSDRMSEDMVFLNGIYQAAATTAGGDFVEVWGGFTDATGSFISSGPDVEGQQTRLRNSDGITMTPAGADKLAFFAQKPIARILGLDDPSLNAPGAATGSMPLEAPEPAVDPANATHVPPVAFSDPAFDGGDGLLAAPGTPRGPSETPSPRERLVRSGSMPAPVAGRADSFAWPRDGG